MIRPARKGKTRKWKAWAVVSGSIPGLISLHIERKWAREKAKQFHPDAKVRAVPCIVTVGSSVERRGEGG